MQITKLNEDSTWLVETEQFQLLIDPWLTPSQVDFHPWFSKQFHLKPQLHFSEWPQPDFIFISHPFTDHCNKETLLKFAAHIPIIALPSILKKIKKWKYFKTLLSIEEAPINIELISTYSSMVHKAFLIEIDAKQMLYAPHGAKLKKPIKADVLLTTRTSYQLPFFLGGRINLGVKAAALLLEQTQSKWAFATHDEQKRAEGIVSKIAKRSLETHPKITDLQPGVPFEIK